MAGLLGINGVTRSINSVIIGKGTFPDHLSKAVGCINGVWRELLTIHEMLDRVEVWITGKDDNIEYSFNSNSITAIGRNLSADSTESVLAYLKFILKDGTELFNWLSEGKYLHKQYNISLNTTIMAYNPNSGISKNYFSILGSGDGLNFSGYSGQKTETYVLAEGNYYISILAAHCNCTATFNACLIDGVSYPVTVVNKL